MAARSKISSAPNGENTSLAGTEAVPVSGSQYTLISTIASYIRTLAQTLTNKTIDLGSNTVTGTTAQFNTALSDGNFATQAGSETLTNKTLTTPTISGAITFPDNTRQTFNPGADAAGLNVGSHAGDPGTPSNGDIWYDSSNNTLDARINGATVNLGAGGGNAFGKIVVSGQSDVDADAASDTLTLVAGSNVTLTTNAGADSVTIAASGSGGGRTLLATDSPTTNTVSFTSISGAYSKLVVEYVARSTRAAQTSDPMTISLNNDTTAANYRLSAIRVTAAGTAAHFGQDGGQYTDPPAASSPSGSAEVGYVEIPYYAGTTFNKQVSVRYHNRRDASSTHEIVSFVGIEWENTAAVTRIDFVLTNGNFVSGSTFNLYGEA